MKKIIMSFLVILLGTLIMTTYSFATGDAPAAGGTGERITDCPGVVDVDCGRPNQPPCPTPTPTPTVAPAGGTNVINTP